MQVFFSHLLQQSTQGRSINHFNGSQIMITSLSNNTGSPRFIDTRKTCIVLKTLTKRKERKETLPLSKEMQNTEEKHQNIQFQSLLGLQPHSLFVSSFSITIKSRKRAKRYPKKSIQSWCILSPAVTLYSVKKYTVF